MKIESDGKALDEIKPDVVVLELDSSREETYQVDYSPPSKPPPIPHRRWAIQFLADWRLFENYSPRSTSPELVEAYQKAKARGIPTICADRPNPVISSHAQSNS